jgi:hypothetical protein
LKKPDERALSKRAADSLHFRELAAAAEDVEKLRALTLGAAERPELIKNDAPGNDRQKTEAGERKLRNECEMSDSGDDPRTRAIEHSPTRRLLKQGEGETSKRAQTALRDNGMRRWDSATAKL